MSLAARHLTPAEHRRLPWKNGRGTTEELALAPAGARFERGDWDWRISKARVEEPGPFSAFPGCERLLVVVAGPGLELRHPDSGRAAHLRPHEPYRFSGDERSEASLRGGPIADFNLIFRRDRVRAELDSIALGERRLLEPLAPGTTFVHLLEGELRARVPGEEEPWHLHPLESLRLDADDPGREIELAGLQPATRLLLARLRPLPQKSFSTEP